MAKSSKKDGGGVEIGASYVSIYADDGPFQKEADKLLPAFAKKAEAQGKKAGSAIGESIADGADEPLKSGLEDSLQEAADKAADSLDLSGIKSKVISGFGALGIGLGIKEIFSSAMSYADVSGSIEAQTKLSVDQAKALTDAVTQTYETGLGESIGDIQDKAIRLQQAMFPSGDQIVSPEMLKKFIGMEEILGYGADEIGRSVGTMLKSGLVDSWDEGLTVLLDGKKSGVDVADDLLDTFDEYSVLFSGLGIKAQTAVNIFKQGIAGGARDTDFIADALKESGIRTRDASASEALAQIGLDAESIMNAVAEGGPEAAAALNEVMKALRAMTDPVVKNNAAVSIFGTKAEDLLGSLYNIDPAAASASASFDEMADATGKAVEANMGFDEQMEAISRTGLSAFAGAVEPLLPMIKTMAAGVIGFLGWLKANPVVSGILLAIGAAIGVAAAAQAVWNAALFASPLTWIVLAVVALVAAIVWLATQTTFFQDSWNGFMGVLDNGRLVIEFLIGALNDFGAVAANVFESARAGAESFIQDLLVAMGLVAEAGSISIDGKNVSDGDRSRMDTWIENGRKGPMPALAEGGRLTKSGSVLVGEYAPEILTLPRGAQVTPLDYASDMAAATRGSGETKVVNINVNNPLGEYASASARKKLSTIGLAI